MRIRSGERRDLARLEPLWLSMVAHHVDCSPPAAEVRPFRELADTWRRRRTRYEEWIDEADARLLLAESDAGELVGYAFLRVGGPEATLITGERVGQLESLAVAPGARGQGAGTALIEQAFAHFRSVGAREMTLAVIEGNDGARRLYERHGLRPYYTALLHGPARGGSRARRCG